MTIEPISTVMSAQAQTIAPKVSPVTAADKVSAEGITPAQASEMVDQTTKAVGNPRARVRITPEPIRNRTRTRLKRL